MKRARIEEEEEESYKIITPPQHGFNEGLVEQYDIDFAIKRAKKFFNKPEVKESVKGKTFYYDQLTLILHYPETEYDEKENSITIAAYDVCCFQEMENGRIVYGNDKLQGCTWYNDFIRFKVYLSYVPTRNEYRQFTRDSEISKDFAKIKQSLLGQRFLPSGELFDSICFLNRKRAV